jgi:hypothetical protein
MGHLRLASLPDTAPWREVVELIAEGASVAGIAQSTIQAAVRGLDAAKADQGLAHAVYLLAHVTIAARDETTFIERLAGLGIQVPSDPNLYDLVGSLSDAMDGHLRNTRSRTDFGEMAQLAAVEALAALAGPKSENLWESDAAPVRSAVRTLSTKEGFATLSHEFFSRFMQRYLTYHLSRELSLHVGPNQRFRDPAEHSEFIERLGVHTRQAAIIVRDYAGGWYSKSKYETGISKASARKFAAYSLTKLRDELRVRGARDVG